MFKNRKITVTVDKKNEDPYSEVIDSISFEEKTEVILKKLEQVGKKVFLGICIYVLLDTKRQVAVARANQPESSKLGAT